MNLLAIETSSELGTVALERDGEILTAELAAIREQSRRIVPAIDALLGRAGLPLQRLDAIAFGRGPGAFTGVRLGASVAQGLGMAGDVGLLAVSSLAALAQQAARRANVGRLLVCVDARMGEVYWGEYAVVEGIAEPVGREALTSPAAVVEPQEKPWVAVGDGFARFPDVLAGLIERAGATHPDWRATAVDLLPLARAALARGEAVAAEHCTPFYLRGQTAWEPRD